MCLTSVTMTAGRILERKMEWIESRVVRNRRWERYRVEYEVYRRKIIALVCWRLIMQDKKKREWRVRPLFDRRKSKGYFHNLIAEMRLGDNEGFFNFHRMSADKFDELLNLVGPLITKHEDFRKDVISASERLSITLRYLASGDSMASLKFGFRVSVSSISNIIKETCSAIWVVLKTIVFPQELTEDYWLSISKQFHDRWNFPNCIGAIDGKHVVMQAPDKAGSLYYNYKGAHSLVLLAVCDAEYCITLLDIGASGRQSDGGVFKNSVFGQALAQDKLNVPGPALIPGSRNRTSPHLLVADAAFPMTGYMMRPYPQRGLTDEQRIFNYRLSRARRVIENVFGIMSARWRIFKRPNVGKLSNIELIIQAVCCLHNFMQRGDRQRPRGERRYCPPSFVDSESVTGNIQDGDWRRIVQHDAGLQPIRRVGANTYARSAVQTRLDLTSYFNEEGQVPWQRKHAGIE